MHTYFENLLPAVAGDTAGAFVILRGGEKPGFVRRTDPPLQHATRG